MVPKEQCPARVLPVRKPRAARAAASGDLESGAARVVEALGGLSPAGLRAVRACCDRLLTAEDDATAAGAPELHIALLLSLRGDGAGCPPESLLRRGPLGTAWRAALASFERVYALFKADNRVRRLAVARLAVALVRRRLQAAGVPQTPATLIRNCINAPADVAAEFPGYAGSGLLAAALRAHGIKETKD